MLTLSIIGISFFSIILGFLIYKFGIPESLSQTYYNLENYKKDIGILFYLYLVVTVFILAIPMIEAAKIWGFISCIGLLFVGAAPAFKEKHQKYIHVCGAALAALGSIILLITINKWIYSFIILAIILILSLSTKTLKQSIVFWLEMLAFYSLFLGLILFYI